ncbi:MAG: hypothetical protein RMJ44_00810 [Cytophagales bacterium]|nr:hypothetical protein [Bernardetiaceae bacterium]MDW8209600.1 hypothetical protein [Cytophagales bacterium]
MRFLNKIYVFYLAIGMLLSALPAAWSQNANSSVAQGATITDWINDPRKLPDIWKQLIKNPLDSSLWAEYYGKSWKDMTMKDLETIILWKQHLMLRHLANNENIIGFVIKPEFRSPDFFIDEYAFLEMMETIKKAREEAKKGKTPIIRAELAGMEAIILQENEELKRLKSNPKANFALIESLYEQIFREFNIKYVYYHEKHPDNKYPLLKWIEDQEMALQELKMKQIAELRSKIKN